MRKKAEESASRQHFAQGFARGGICAWGLPPPQIHLADAVGM